MKCPNPTCNAEINPKDIDYEANFVRCQHCGVIFYLGPVAAGGE